MNIAENLEKQKGYSIIRQFMTASVTIPVKILMYNLNPTVQVI